jgi:predicted nucleic acid-binding protein
MFVCDTNLIAYLLIQGPFTPIVQEIFRRTNFPIVPPFWKVEFLNILSTYMKKGFMTLSDAEMIWANTSAIPLLEEEPSLDLVLKLAYQSGCSAYDCMFVALAVEHELNLITFDEKLLKIFPEYAVHPHQAL